MNARLLLTFFSIMISFGLSAQSIGIIGSATPGGWDIDTDMTQDAMNTDMWTLEITLFDGAVKFRQDDDWAVNWGSSDFPTGTGEQDGADIPVFAGDYTITFNSATGEYNFAIASDIGIIGSSTPGGWDTDTNMFSDPTDSNKYFINITLLEGDMKFRQDDDWAVNWGSMDFPMGTGVQDGDNIPVPAGEYAITFDKSTGEYSFDEIITFSTIGLIGTATPGGWDTDTDLTQSSSDPNVWSANMTLVDGEAKFRANDAWAIDWGSADWPSGTGVAGGDNIPVVGGDYLVTLNTETGEYSFQEIVEFQTIGLIGDATPNGWAADTEMMKDPDDGSMWTLRVILVDGEAKFRANSDWAINWGAGDFPMGIGEQDGANIPVTAGEYIISFNSITGAYFFEEIVVFQTVGLIGPATPVGDWDTDVDLTQSPDNEHLWTLDGVDLVDGEAKFRAEDDWAVNWGLDVWPAGIGTQDGPNIPVIGGTYNVSVNTLTGEYGFADPSSTKDILDPANIKVFPNPTDAHLNIDLDAIEFKGDVQLTIMDMTGRVLKVVNGNSNTLQSVEVGDLANGNYFLQIANEKFLIGKRFSVSK